MTDVLHIQDKNTVGLTLCGRYALTCSLLTDDIDADGRFVCAKCAQRGVTLRVAERLAEGAPACCAITPPGNDSAFCELPLGHDGPHASPRI